MSIVEEAHIFATSAHKGQVRKGTATPYIIHPEEVATIVAEMTKDEDVIAAAYLHDTIEDCVGITKEVLAKEFNTRIAHIVSQESEDKSKSWMERKGGKIESLKHASYEVQVIALGDKLANLRDIDREYQERGDELWNKFNMKDKNVIGWYYRGVKQALEERFAETKAFQEYEKLVEKNFG